MVGFRVALAAGCVLGIAACSPSPASDAGDMLPAGGSAVAAGGQTSAGHAGSATGLSGAGTGATGGAGAGVGGSGTGTAGGGSANAAGGGGLEQPGALRPFPQHSYGAFCSHPTAPDDGSVVAAYRAWKDLTVTADGAGAFLRVKKPDSGAIVGSTASEGIGYGMLLAAYLGDQTVFDGLFGYALQHLDANGLMNWDIAPDGTTAPNGAGAATDGDVDMTWALLMADRQWGGQGALPLTYLEHAKDLIERIWTYEVDHSRGEMLMAGDQWGDVDVTNPSYFAPAYFRVFGRVTNQEANWNKVIDRNYEILAASLNAASGNAKNGLAPAWCDSSGKPVEAYAGAPTYFQNDATRVPFRVGQDYCYFGEPRAKAYLALIGSFYSNIGVANIVDGYDLDGTPHPERAVGGLQAASFVGPAGVAGMSDPQFQTLLNDAYAAVATQGLTAGTQYYQSSWTALSLLMLTGNFVDLTAP